MANVVGDQELAAAIQLRKSGLELSTTAHMPYSGAAPGVVISQDPPANGKDVERPSVSLLVASAPTEELSTGFVMPDFTGQSLSIAASQLNMQGIKVDPPKWVDIGVSPVGEGNAPIQQIRLPGTILTQVPAAGNFVSPETPVQFAVVR
jgi:beta-lactam-binding protein with PASTA domain